MADLLDDFMRHLRVFAPDLPAQTALQLEVQVRKVWGGSKHNYIAKRPLLQNATNIGEGLRAQRPLAQVFEDAGISRRHGYRVLRTK